MRCRANITENALLIRSRHAPPDPRCQRRAVRDGLCRQHAAMRFCQARGCDKPARVQEGKWWFCRQHGRLWAQHNRIVERILAIPVRR